MGKAHSNAYRQVGRFFDLDVYPVMKVLCGRDEAKVKAAADKFGWFEKAEPGAPGFGPYGGGGGDLSGKFDVERRIEVFGQLANGVSLRLDAAWAMHTDLERMGFRLIGSKGTLHVERVWPLNDGSDAAAIDTATYYTTRERAGKPWSINKVFNPDSDPMVRDTYMGRTKTQPEMLAAIRAGRKPKTNVDQLLAIQEIIDAAYRSAAAHGEPVSLSG